MKRVAVCSILALLALQGQVSASTHSDFSNGQELRPFHNGSSALPTIKQSSLRVTEQPRAEWYQQGSWPLVGAVAVLIVTNGIGLWKIYLQSQSGLRSQLKIKQVEYVSQQLTEFYNPIFTLLLLNREAFSSMGPITFPEDPIRRDAAGEVWAAVKENVIIPNNRRMQEILRDKSHLISKEDSLESYMQLQNHLGMYEIFQETPTELYARFQFPASILQHVESNRKNVIATLNKLKEE